MGGRTEIMTVELKKVSGITERSVEQMDIRERWVLFMLKYRERIDEKTGIIQKIIGMEEGIAAADRVFQGFTESQLEAIAAIAKDKFEFDAREDLWEMKHTAQEAGRAEGRAEAIKDTARKLKAMGIPLEQIAEASGLQAEVIEGL